MEENHYYSYGLKIAAISSKAADAIQNRYLYQDDFSECDEETGYNEFYLRHYDPRIGRWVSADPYEEFANLYLAMANNPTLDTDRTGACVWCETSERALALPEIVINGKGGSSIGSAMMNFFSSSVNYFNPLLNSSINTLRNAGSEINWFGRGLWNEGVMPTVDWMNHNINPVYGVLNGINSQFTGKDFLSGYEMTRADGVSGFIFSVMPGGTLIKVA